MLAPRIRSRLVVLAFLVTTAGLFRCGPTDAVSSTDSGPIRLIDELEWATITSRLDDVPGWDEIHPELPREVVWRPVPAQLPGGCGFVNDSRIQCKGGGSFSFGYGVPVKPNSLYEVVMTAHGEKNQCAAVRFRDRDETRVVRLSDEPEEIVETRFTKGMADQLEIAFRGDCKATIDSLHLPTFDGEAELALLASRSPYLGASSGIAKFGALLPHSDAETVGPPFDGNFGFRETLFAPAPTRIRTRVHLGADARLRFSYSMADLSRPGDQMRFEVLVDDRSVWSRDLTLARSSWHWHEQVIDLSEYAGDVVDLTLQTSSDQERGYGLWGTPTIDVARQPVDPPNVILLAVDTLRADRLSSYGYPEPLSPNLDALARDGVLFQYAISQSNRTQPAFASLFTGNIVPRHRLLKTESRLAGTAPTLARIFRQNGWTTHGIMYKAALYDPDSLARGFERYFNVPRQVHRADQNVARALEWLDSNADRRFFLFLHFNDPHQPFTHPEDFVGETTARSLATHDTTIPFNVSGTIGECKPCQSGKNFSDEFKHTVRELYDEEVAYVDNQVGLFLEALKQRGLYDDTIIAFVSDHGETLWDRFNFFDHGGINQHDELTRVPLVIKPTKGRGFLSGSTVSTQVPTFDLMPTLLELVDIDTSVLSLDAGSLVPMLLEDTGQDDRWAHSGNEQAASLRGEGFLYVYPIGNGPEPRIRSEQLYNLNNDPEATTDIATRDVEALNRMRVKTMELLIRSLGGHFLLIVGSGDTDVHGVTIRVANGTSWDLMAHLGLRPVQRESTVWRFTGPAPAGRMVLFLRLTGEGASSPTVRVTSQGPPVREQSPQPQPFEKDLLDRLLTTGDPGVYLIEAPGRATIADEASDGRMDRGQEEALRALGYIE